jgi:hypothetical protein
MMGSVVIRGCWQPERAEVGIGLLSGVEDRGLGNGGSRVFAGPHQADASRAMCCLKW